MSAVAPKRYPFAERFHSLQGEGHYVGTPCAFARLVGCSVGQKVCTHCDTRFDVMRDSLGGGLFTAQEIVDWAESLGRHLCLTGGEPLDRDITEIMALSENALMWTHIETGGTVHPEWLHQKRSSHGAVIIEAAGGSVDLYRAWITVSPKPGWKESMIDLADEVKVILGGLGDGSGWPTLEDARRWADAGKMVYVQPRNHVNLVDPAALQRAVDVTLANPRLKLSVQMHKFLGTR